MRVWPLIAQAALPYESQYDEYEEGGSEYDLCPLVQPVVVARIAASVDAASVREAIHPDEVVVLEATAAAGPTVSPVIT